MSYQAERAAALLMLSCLLHEGQGKLMGMGTYLARWRNYSSA